MNPFAELPGEINHLLNSVAGQTMYGPITTYTPFIILGFILVLVLIFSAKSQLALVPKNRFMGVVEFFVDFTQKDVVFGVIGNTAKKHVPYFLTLFIFLLIINVVGIIPGSKAAGGTIGATLALTIISFTYFTVYGIKHHGFFAYIKSVGPSGIKPAPLGAVIWGLEFFSMLLRLLTLSVRLFANLFAGHLLLGVLAILTTLFITPLITAFSAAAIPFSLAGVVLFALLTIMYAMEVFVAVIQAYIFTLLSSVYVMLATSEH